MMQSTVTVVTPEIVPEEKEALAVVQAQSLLPDTAKSLNESFAPLFAQARSVLEKSRGVVVTDASQKLEMGIARQCRLALRAVRIEGDKIRKSLKEESLRKGKAIDSFYSILDHLVATEETRLDEQEKFVERQEAARKAKLKADREDTLRPYGIDTAFFQLADMPEAAWTQLLENTKAAHERKQEAQRKAEEDRIRVENERLKEEARVREENARLKQEAEAREAAAKEERARVEAERSAADAAAKAERARLEAIAAGERRKAAEAAEIARKEREAAAAENARKLAEQQRKAEESARAADEARKKELAALEIKRAEERRAADVKAMEERAAREKAEGELLAARELAEKAKAREEVARKKAAAAPDRAKLAAYWAALDGVARPTMASLDGQRVMQEMDLRMASVANWLREEANKL